MRAIEIGVVVWALVVSASAVWCVTPTEWTEATQEDFEQGQPEDVAITSEGSIVLSFARRELTDADSLELLIWALLEDSKGNVYAGTGNKGKILKIDAQGKQSLFFDSPEVAIHSLAMDAKGDLYAGSSPDGIVYRIAADGRKSEFVAEGNSYIWALAFSSAGRLYAATGEHGKLLEVSSGGQFTEIFDASDAHLMCLVADEKGNLFAGSEGNGIVYKFEGNGKASVLYDAPEPEIRCLVLGPEGSLYAGAMSGTSVPGRGGPGAGPHRTPAPFQRVAARGFGQPPNELGERAEPEAPAAEAGCAIYRISPAGAVSKIWRSADPQLLAMIVDRAGELIVGTGDEGKVYKVTPEGKSTLLAKLDEAQPLCLVERRDGKVLVGTGNVGRVYEFSSGYTKTGTYESEVHDAVIRCQWGKAFWRAEVDKKTRLVLQTRTGNTQEPDKTWSEWSVSLEDPEGSQIPSPPSRFIQYRARLETSDATKTPELWEVHVLGLQDNMAPKIESVTLTPFKGVGEGVPPGIQVPPMPTEGPASKLARIKGGLVSVSWEATDPNNDTLVFDLYFRGTGEAGWKLLIEEHERNAYLWDTESCPDGQIELKVVGSDRRENPSDIALSAEKVSEPFYVDKLPPRVRLLKVRQLEGRKVQAEGDAEDATSRLQKGAFAIDASDWQVIFPKDRIFDGRKEAFSFTAEALEPGEHTLVVRIFDALDNVGVAKAVFEVK